MTLATIDFSAQFGGQDAATIALPHFKALKVAARGLELERFPYPKLAFILRVDGSVTRFGFSGPRHLEIDRREKYLSVDIGISLDDRTRIADAISEAIISSTELIKSDERTASWTVDFSELEKMLEQLVGRYKNQIADSP